MRLGELLVSAGLITREQLARGLESQTIHGGRLGTNLVELGFVSERQLAGSLSEQLGVPYVSAEMVANISPSLIAAMPGEVAAEFRAFPIKLKGRVLYVCMASPGDIEKVDALAFRLSRTLQPCVVTELTLDFVLERYYGIPRGRRLVAPQHETVPDSAIVQVSDEPSGLSRGIQMSRGNFLSNESGEFFREDFTGLPRIATNLADVKTEADVIEAMKVFFSAAFPQSVILALSEGGLSPVAETGLGLDIVALSSMRIPMREDCFLRGNPQGVGLNFHLSLTDPALVLVCERIRMATDQVTMVPVKQGQQLRYLVLGRGLDLPDLRKIQPAIETVARQVACALQIVKLRRHLLEGNPGCESGS